MAYTRKQRERKKRRRRGQYVAPSYRTSNKDRREKTFQEQTYEGSRGSLWPYLTRSI